MEKVHQIPTFVHLRVRSSSSLGEGLSTPAEICAFAHRSGFKSIALTDTNHVYGFLDFHREAEKYGIKPIYGAVLYHTTFALGGDSRYPFTLLALTGNGLKHLVELASLSSLLAESDSALGEDLLRLHAEGLAVLLDAKESELAHLVEMGKEENAKGSLETFKDIYGSSLFIEIQEEEDKNPESRDLSKTRRALAAGMGVKSILTEDVRYVGHGRQGILNLLGEVRHPNLGRDFFVRQDVVGNKGMKSAAEMAKLYYAYNEAYENTVALERMVIGDLLDELQLLDGQPNVRTPFWRFADAKDTFHDKVHRRFELYFHFLSRQARTNVKTILDYEIELIGQLGLERTFLLYHEIIAYFRDAKISLGPATGLSVQSLCAYLLGITFFNPYEFDESFQPLLDPASGKSGILEVQLGSGDREAAVQCLQNIFDRHCIAYIPAVEHITSSRAIKIVAKNLEMDDLETSEIVKITMSYPGRSLKSLVETSKALGQIYRRSARVRELISQAALIEGLPCGFIRSKRSVVVSPRPIRESLGYTMDKSSNELFVQATREVFPIGGMYRIDFTPLSALTVCIKTDRELRKNREKAFSWDQLPIDDKSTWQDIQKGQATGVYLLESPLIQEQAKSFSPQSIEDMTHFLALMRMRDDEKSFAERIEAFQSGTGIDFDYLPALVPLLNRTHGLILYEEQLRDILILLTGVDAGEAYRMLECFREGGPKELSELRSGFMQGTADSEVPMEAANEWFEKILFYSKRTMSRQRILADALLIYKAFYLKCHHHFYYYLSLLNTYYDNETKAKNYLAYLHDLDALLPIDINKSELYYTLEREKIRMGISMVDGVGYPSLLRILKARGRRKFRSLEQFIRRTKAAGVSMEEVGNLILIGAFDFTNISRTNLVNALPELYEQPVNGATNGLNGQFELALNFPEPGRGRSAGGSSAEEDFLEKLVNAKQKKVEGLGTGEFRIIETLEQFYSRAIASLVELNGRISNLQRLKTKSGKVYGFFVLFDFSALVQVFVPWDKFGLLGDVLEEGRDVVIRGRVTIRDERKVCEALEIKSAGEEEDGEVGESGSGGNAEKDS
jgi:DNA polymerase-3 subunit alpha